MYARVTKCLREDCDNPVPETVGRGRKQRFCTDACRKAHSRINGHENRSDRQSYPGGKNTDLVPSQPLENVDAVCPLIQEREPSRSRARSAKELRFEEYPPRQKKTDRCITYKLTDGQQINTGYGRASRPLGYVMEIVDGRWVARVENLSSAPLTLGAAKKAAIELYRSKDKGQPKDWIRELNLATVAVIDPPPSVTQSLTDDGHYHVKVCWGDFEAEFPHSEYPEDDAGYQLYDWGFRGTLAMRWLNGGVATFVKAARRPSEASNGPTPGALQGDDCALEYYEDGYPKLPACLDRRALPAMAKAA
jgi:hypothetical protein